MANIFSGRRDQDNAPVARRVAGRLQEGLKVSNLAAGEGLGLLGQAHGNTHAELIRIQHNLMSAHGKADRVTRKASQIRGLRGLVAKA